MLTAAVGDGDVAQRTSPVGDLDCSYLTTSHVDLVVADTAVTTIMLTNAAPSCKPGGIAGIIQFYHLMEPERP